MNSLADNRIDTNAKLSRTRVYFPVDIDYNKLKRLGFIEKEISLFERLHNAGVSITSSNMFAMGYNYEQFNRIKYLRDICMGKITIETVDDLCRHLKRMNNRMRKIGIQDLSLSSVRNVDRAAIIGGITDKNFNIYNSCRYSEPKDRLYKVLKVTSNNVHILTRKRPVLKFKESKKVEGVIEILEEANNGDLVIAVNKNHCRLVNRFVVAASLRRPEFHLGMVEIICPEGTKVYVYAQDVGTSDKLKYAEQSKRIYDFGFLANSVNKKVINVSKRLGMKLGAVYYEEYPANTIFRTVTRERVTDREEIEIED